MAAGSPATTSHMPESGKSDEVIGAKDMKKEQDRLMTFLKWPTSSPVGAERLARAGMFFTGDGDLVECFCCGGVLDGWNFGDDVMKRHRKTYPDCDFVRGQSENVPYLKSTIESKLHMQLIESMDSGLDHSISRPTTPCSSVYLFGSREDVHRGSRYGSNDSAYRSLNRRASVISGATSDITDAFSEGLDMKLEKNRRKSFNKWPVTYLTSTDLAASGFFFTGYQDRVRCAFCGGILGMWQPGDNPWTEHQKHFPWCNFVKKGYSSDYSSAQSSPTGNNNSTDVCGPFCPLPHIPSRHPCSPYLNDYDARIATFRNWPPNRMQTPEHLAYAGFFYTGVNDNVRCFFCDGGLRCWDPQDDAWQEHAKWFPNCLYLLETKGAEFVNSVQKSLESEKVTRSVSRNDPVPSSPTSDEESIVRRVLEMGFAQPSVEQAVRDRHTKEQHEKFRNVEELINGVLDVEYKKKRPEAKPARSANNIFAKLRSLSKDPDTDVAVEKLAEENRILRQQRRCKICMDKEVSTVFLPCGHLISCADCAPSLRTCALCRRGIRGTVKTYLS